MLTYKRQLFKLEGFYYFYGNAETHLCISFRLSPLSDLNLITSLFLYNHNNANDAAIKTDELQYDVNNNNCSLCIEK